MPSWLWRAWLGPAGRGPRGLLGRRPRRRRLLPPPPEGLPGPAFIVLSKLLGRIFDPVQVTHFHNFRFPIWLRQALAALAHSHFSCGASPLARSHHSVTLLSHTREPSSIAKCLRGHGPTFRAELRAGLDAIAIDRSLVKQTRTSEKNSKFCVSVIRYRNPSRRRERPGARKANAGTRPMRTTQWYSSVRGRARGKVGAFLHRRT